MQSRLKRRNRGYKIERESWRQRKAAERGELPAEERARDASQVGRKDVAIASARESDEGDDDCALRPAPRAMESATSVLCQVEALAVFGTCQPAVPFPTPAAHAAVFY